MTDWALITYIDWANMDLSQDTIMLIQEQCPSLSAVPSSCISLHLRFDGNTQDAVKNVLFKVLPSAWPGAVSEVLPLVYIKVKNQDTKVGRPASAQCDNGNKGTCNACERMASHPKTGGSDSNSSIQASRAKARGANWRSNMGRLEKEWNITRCPIVMA